MFQTKFVYSIKTHIFLFGKIFRKSCRLRDNVEKHGRARQAADGNIIPRMRFPCLTNEATGTHIVFRGNSGYAKSPHCYVRLTLPVLLNCSFLPYNKISVGIL